VSGRDQLQELRELGISGTIFRASWELRARAGILGQPGPAPPRLSPGSPEARDWSRRLPFADPRAVAAAMRERLPEGAVRELLEEAQAASRGRIRCFGSKTADFGDPIDWHRNPGNGERWPSDVPWPSALRDEPRVGEVKLTWEAARFPHAYVMARAAAFSPAAAPELRAALLGQIESFLRHNPYARGLHWFSGQEIALRLMAWVFALDTLLSRGDRGPEASVLVGDGLLAGATHIERHIAYAEKAVYNNHLIAEALALYMVGTLLPDTPGAARWRRRGRDILEEQADRQFYADGAYILQSHNYERGALLYLLWAGAVARAGGDRPARSWTAAIERGLDFLIAHQNPGDGWLPNFGANDGSLPSVLACSAFPDFRPVLQLASLATRGERLFAPGPADEAAAWFLGPSALEAPLRPPTRRSVAFSATGYVVLRGRDDGCFASFRCGSLRDRFSQIDMLHLDVFWRGRNLLVDGGSYLYNAPGPWHAHFVGTASHNTVVVDGRDQMLLFRRFKALYWTEATLLGFADAQGHAVVTGEHYGYRRHRGGCVHRRSVLFVKDDLFVVADRVLGSGRHRARLQWLGGDFPHQADEASGRLSLETPEGAFGVAVYGADGEPLPGSVARGQESPPRGWLSRHFGEKVPVPSLAVEAEGESPIVFLTVAGAGRPALERDGAARWLVRGAASSATFRLEDGVIADVR
jgi:hypothetical protein